MKTRTVKVRGDGKVISGASYCYRTSRAAHEASRAATVNPSALGLWAGGRDYYLVRGEVSAATRETTYYGRGGRIVRVVEVAS